MTLSLLMMYFPACLLLFPLCPNSSRDALKRNSSRFPSFSRRFRKFFPCRITLPKSSSSASQEIVKNFRWSYRVVSAHSFTSTSPHKCHCNLNSIEVKCSRNCPFFTSRYSPSFLYLATVNFPPFLRSIIVLTCEFQRYMASAYVRNKNSLGSHSAIRKKFPHNNHQCVLVVSKFQCNNWLPSRCRDFWETDLVS